MTADGYKPVEDIAVGALVYSVNEQTGALELKEVYGTYVGYKDELYTIATATGAITATEEHPFWVVDKGWVEAKDLCESDMLKDADGNGIAIQSIVHTSTEGTTIYNFSVTDNHNCFAGENGLLTHNINCADLHPKIKSMVDNAGKVDATQFNALLNDIENGTIDEAEARVIRNQLDQMAGGTNLFAQEIQHLDNAIANIGDVLLEIRKLKNVGNFNNSSLEHIFSGKNNKGFHYEGLKNTNGVVVAGTRTAPEQYGVYKATVDINGVRKGGFNGESTFFPSSWTPQQVVDSINDAYSNKIFSKGNTYVGKLPNGMEIDMYIDPNGKIISAFPTEAMAKPKVVTPPPVVTPKPVVTPPTGGITTPGGTTKPGGITIGEPGKPVQDF